MAPEPFRVAIPQNELDELHRRLDATRWAADFENEDWRYGVEAGWLRDLVRYWRHDFDWRAQERAINQWPQYRVELDGVPIHFVHVRGKGENPIPLILTHGWPWTFWDFRHLIGPLTDPLAHGLDPGLCFDLVIPSLPGYGFSTPLRKTGVGVPEIARLWVTLMRDVLGYARFGAAGGDWGAVVTSQLGHAHAEQLIGIYQTMVVFPGHDLGAMHPDQFAADEKWMLKQNAEMFARIASHIAVHTYDPQTLAYALVDSPVGTAAWLWERRRAWSDWSEDVFEVMDRDALCTLASIYWLTGTIGTSLRLYSEFFVANGGMINPLTHDRKPVIGVPAGYGVFPKDVMLVPRAVADANADVHRWSILPKGGHFAPAEQPELVVDELRAFFGQLQQSGVRLG